MPFTKNDVTKSGNREWGIGLGNGTGSGEWKGRMESGTRGIGNGNMKWEIENGKLFFFCVGCSFLSVLWNDFMKNKYFLSSNKQKTLFNLELNFKRRLIAVDLRFESWGVSLGWYHRISPSFRKVIFVNVKRLDYSWASNNIWWIIIEDIPQVIFLNFQALRTLQ